MKSIILIRRLRIDFLTQLEKELGKPPANFVKDFLLAGKSARLAGKADMSLAEFNKVLQETPELQPYVTARVRDFMRDNFEKQQLDEGGLFQTDNFDVSGFISFIKSTVFVSIICDASSGLKLL